MPEGIAPLEQQRPRSAPARPDAAALAEQPALPEAADQVDALMASMGDGQMTIGVSIIMKRLFEVQTIAQTVRYGHSRSARHRIVSLQVPQGTACAA
jgi:hypothetical protein